MDARHIFSRSKRQRAQPPLSAFDSFSKSAGDYPAGMDHRQHQHRVSSSDAKGTLVSLPVARSYDVHAGTEATILTTPGTRPQTRVRAGEGTRVAMEGRNTAEGAERAAMTSIESAPINEHHYHTPQHQYRHLPGDNKRHLLATSSTVHGLSSLSSSTPSSSRKKSSHSRDDMEFWASLYAQHPVYSRQGPRTDSALQYTSFSPSHALAATPAIPPAKSNLFSKSSNKSTNNSSTTTSNRSSVKVWQVLTKTDLSDHQCLTSSKSTRDQQQLASSRFRFERLPIKAPQTSSPTPPSNSSSSSSSKTTTPVALSSKGKPFSIVFFFTIESSPSTAVASSKSKSKSLRSRQSSSSSSSSSLSPSLAATTTLWYLETAYTVHKTLHEHMELMGTFLPNAAANTAPLNGGQETPLYIYETQPLDFQQLSGGGRNGGAGNDTIVLDLKLQSPEGGVYADFSYRFIQEDRPKASTPAAVSAEMVGRSRSNSANPSSNSNNKISSSRSENAVGAGISRGRRRYTATPAPSSKSELASPLRNSTAGANVVWDDDATESGDDGDDDDFEQAKAHVKASKKSVSSPTALDAAADEPDAGEHFMQATSQFFSKMGYWLYNSKVVQYIARDDRVRTKTAFPAEDIWMLGVCYSFEQPDQGTALDEAVADEVKDTEDTQQRDADAVVVSPQYCEAITPEPAAHLEPTLSPAPPTYTPSSSPTPDTTVSPTPTLQEPSSPLSSSPPPLSTSGDTSPDRPKYPRSMSLSQFASASPRRSAATSSLSCEEAQSHSHSRYAGTNTTSTSLEDAFKQAVSISGGSRVSYSFAQSMAPSTPVTGTSASTSLPGSPRSSLLLSTLSKAALSGLTSQPIFEDAVAETPTRDGFDAESPQLAPAASLDRKPGRRRMTISGLFSWDANATTPTGSDGSSDNTNSSSITALKSLMASTMNSSPSAAASGVKHSAVHKSAQLPQAESGTTTPVVADPASELTTPVQVTTPVPAAVVPSVASVSGTLVPITESLPIDDLSLTLASRDKTMETPRPLRTPSPLTSQPVYSSSPVASEQPLSQQPSASDSSSAAADAPVKRERKRKTGRALVSNNGTPVSAENSSQGPSPTTRDSSNTVAFKMPKPLRSPMLTGAKRGEDTIPRTPSPLSSSFSSPLSASSRSSFFSIKRQNSFPVSLPASKSKATGQQQQRSDNSEPPSPSSSPSSSLRRSWRSLSLSLATTAKSSLPFSLSSPSRTRSPGFLGQKDEQQRKPVHEATGFGHEYDYDGYDDDPYGNNSNTSSNDAYGSLISLPPAITSYMSMLRPSPASAITGLTAEQEVLRQFLMDFQSRLWFTYRKDLSRIEPSFYTCDSGWGCMMRTGQSLLAQGFVQVLLCREWNAHLSQTPASQRRYHEILNWFVDEPDRPYSIHRIAKAGLTLDKRIGEWFGPSTVAHALKRLSQGHEDCPLSIIVPMDGSVKISTIIQAATQTTQRSSAATETTGAIADVSIDAAWKPVLLMIPTRFGLDKLTEKYTNNLKQLFKIPQFLGIAGGRPGRSLYFVACQGNELFYYDPHFVKPRAFPEELGTCPVPSFHCPVVRSMEIQELDPSMLLGFLIQSRGDLQDLKTRLDRDMEKAYPLLTIQDDTPMFMQTPAKPLSQSRHFGRSHIAISEVKKQERAQQPLDGKDGEERVIPSLPRQSSSPSRVANGGGGGGDGDAGGFGTAFGTGSSVEDLGVDVFSIKSLDSSEEEEEDSFEEDEKDDEDENALQFEDDAEML